MQEIITSDSPEVYRAEYEKLSYAVKSLAESTLERDNWETIVKMLAKRLYRAMIEPVLNAVLSPHRRAYFAGVTKDGLAVVEIRLEHYRAPLEVGQIEIPFDADEDTIIAALSVLELRPRL
jgi:hypothetical protein